jgi:DNA-binding MarR family transcriptional regulator
MENSGGAVAAVTATQLAAALTVDLERILGLFRSLTEPGGLSLTAAATLASIERFGPQRLTALAAREGVTQPAMTQLISRLEDAGQVRRESDPDDGRVVLVTITDAGRATLAHRRDSRATRLAAILGQLSPEQLAVLDAARPALDALASVPRDDEPARGTTQPGEQTL